PAPRRSRCSGGFIHGLLALLHAISAAFVFSSRDASAQVRSGDRGPSLAALGAAIAEAQRSPFHRVDPVGSIIAPGSARGATMPARGGVRRATLPATGQDAATDEAPTPEVFLLTAAATHLSDIVGLYLLGGAFREAYSTDGSRGTVGLLMLSSVGVAVLGPTLATWFLGREFGRALLGSALGVVLGAGVYRAVVESAPFFLAYSLSAVVHAGTVTLIVW
ncbi:MAG: hypothetical protein OXU64_12735, partial [Gemmatimonadota bacterium]|nr:hypothetical protein [Gemmatimonadota bacterium]